MQSVSWFGTFKVRVASSEKTSNFHPFKPKNWDFLEGFCKSKDFKKSLLIKAKFKV